MGKLFHILFLSCLKASELVEKRFHFKLSIIEKFQLRIHIMMCKGCTKHSHQSELIEESISKMQAPTAKQKDIDALKNKISEQLKNQAK